MYFLKVAYPLGCIQRSCALAGPGFILKIADILAEKLSFNEQTQGTIFRICVIFMSTKQIFFGGGGEICVCLL